MSYKLPKNTRAWTIYKDSKGNERFIMASDPMRTEYTLYEIGGEKLNKLGSGPNPKIVEDDCKLKERLQL